ncbi:hypothetical protein DPMN_185123 [Dreissena polymorpha]|uniref:Uncharacterized protein n=2 Tax=Dreissena polymorpha TaxID=45954 RepID=A0A9D4I588_DREPO|nr:hypothetical protein DPMN_185123 [Dreissena polymorpha]
MRQDLQQKITTNLRAIKKDIDAKDLLDIFIEKNVFKFSDKDEITGFNPNTQESRNNCFIKKLLQKDDYAYALFIDALKENGSQHLADLLENTKVDSQNPEAGVLDETATGKQHTQSVPGGGCNTIGEKISGVKTNYNGDNYSQAKEMLLDLMIKRYENTLSTIKIAPSNDVIHARVDDIYMPPKLQLMKKNKGAFEKTEIPITKYSKVFLKDSKYNRNMFIQGEAGSGKSTFLAKLVRDWCSKNIKTSGKQIQTGEHNIADANARLRPSDFFEDVKTLKEYKFVFYVTLRDSVNEIYVLEILKKQIIDEVYGDKDERENAYRLLNDIMKNERCLILLDGLDEWTCNEERSLPVLADTYSQCNLLITSRPWKMTEAMIPDAKIDTMLQLEGVNDPFEWCRRLLDRSDYCKDSNDLDTKQSKFKAYILKNDLMKFLISPMLLQLIVYSWVEGTEMNGSMCEIYSLFLDSLLKKANKKKRKFPSSSFQCFKDTEHIRPNIENVNRLAEAAFHLLFSNTRDSSLVFSDTDLERFGLDEGEQKEFALKSGILTATQNPSIKRSSSSFSFFHKSIQEFLAAYYIAYNTHPFDEIISGYLNRYKDAYMDISQVFIFLCGLEISAADKLSSMMNERDVDSCNYTFPNIMLSGYREAVANKHDASNLKLSNFNLMKPVTEIGDLHNMWINNTAHVLSFSLFIEGGSQSSPEKGDSATHEFDLSSCSKLKSLCLIGQEIWLKDFACSTISKHPVWIVLNSADPLPVLPCIDWIALMNVTISSRCLRSLLSSLLTLDHKVNCTLEDCSITSSVQESDSNAYVKLEFLNNTLVMRILNDSPLLWDSLHSLNIKSLSLSGLEKYVLVKDGELLSQSLSSLTHLETLTIQLRKYIFIQPPQSLKNLSMYFRTLLPSQLRELMDTLRACTQTIECKLEFGCAMLTYADNNDDDDHHHDDDHEEEEEKEEEVEEEVEGEEEEKEEEDDDDDDDDHERIKQIALEEYIPVVQEVETLTNVAVKRFRILDRTGPTNWPFGNDSCWSVRSNGDVYDDNQDGDIVKDKLYRKFLIRLNNEIIHRISMRLLITPASASTVSNQYGCNT